MTAHPDFQPIVRNWLIRALDESSVSRKQLGEALQLSPSAITRLLSGERQISGAEMFVAGSLLGWPQSFRDMLNKLMPYDAADAAVMASREQEHNAASVERASYNPRLYTEESELRHRMPLNATSVGDDTCDLYLNMAVEQYINRPRGALIDPTAIALRMRGAAFDPRYQSEEVMVIVNARVVTVGQYLLCEMPSSPTEMNAIPFRLGIVRDRNGDQDFLLAHSDGSERRIRFSEVLSFYQPIGWNALLRVVG